VACETEHQLSFTRDLPLSQGAAAFARERHAGQTRAADQAAFVIHPIEAASMLERAGYPDHVVAAAVLHDVLEDTETDGPELFERFGPEVADLVAVVSDDPAIADPDERRDDVRERVRSGAGYAPVIYAADKVSKVRELRTMIAGGLSTDDADNRRQHYTRCLAMLEETIPGSPIVEALRFELEALEELPPGTANPS
jgi:(p)ppGpp synthase/HD superfamily hydrolase